jgi:hypothetical protein
MLPYLDLLHIINEILTKTNLTYVVESLPLVDVDRDLMDAANG